MAFTSEWHCRHSVQYIYSNSIKQVYPAVKFPLFMTVVYRETHVFFKYILIWANTNDVDLIICDSTKNRNRVGTVGFSNIRAILTSCHVVYFVLHERRPAFSSCGDAAAAFVWPKGKHIKLIIFYLKKWNIHYSLERRKKSSRWIHDKNITRLCSDILSAIL